MDGGVYRVSRVARSDAAQPGGPRIEVTANLLTSAGGEPEIPTTFIDYNENPYEYHLSAIQTILHTRTRMTDLYSNRFDQLREQIRLIVELVKEREEWELLNNVNLACSRKLFPASASRPHRRADPRRPPHPVWKKPAFFLAHPLAIAAFGRECTRRGVPPPTVHILGSSFLTWRGVPLVPTDKLEIFGEGDEASTRILLLRVGESEQGVVGLQKSGVTGELEVGLSVRYMGTNKRSIASHLVTRYASVAVLTDDAIASLDNVLINKHHDYVYPVS